MEITENVFEKFVLEIYDEYKEFIGVDKRLFPKINPVRVDSEVDEHNLVTPAYVSFDNLVGECADVYFSIDIFNYHERARNSIFYHEFTHIFDANVTLRNFSDRDRFMFIRTYSEFNAARIEMLYNIGFDRLSDVNNMNPFLRTAYYCHKEVPVSTYVSKPIDAIRQIIKVDSSKYSNLSEEKYMRIYKIFHNETMYYLGYKYVYESLFRQKPYKMELAVFGQFYETILEIENHLKNRNLPMLIEPELRLFELFKKSFPNVNNL